MKSTAFIALMASIVAAAPGGSTKAPTPHCDNDQAACCDNDAELLKHGVAFYCSPFNPDAPKCKVKTDVFCCDTLLSVLGLIDIGIGCGAYYP